GGRGARDRVAAGASRSAVPGWASLSRWHAAVAESAADCWPRLNDLAPDDVAQFDRHGHRGQGREQVAGRTIAGDLSAADRSFDGGRADAVAARLGLERLL